MTSPKFPVSRQRRRGSGRKVLESAAPDAGAKPAAPRLPHEHDENADSPHAPRAPIVQAADDLAQGQQDTDLRGKASEALDKATTRGGR